MESPTTTDRHAERATAPRDRLKSRHASALAKLMAEREDLKGTHAFADIVDDALRWSA